MELELSSNGAEAITEWLSHIRDLTKNNAPKGYRYASHEALVLAEGRLHVSAALPHNVRRGPKRECFANALRLALNPPDEMELAYCEGFALGQFFPILHAWCVHYPNGDDEPVVIDPTWDNPESCHYYGIEFDPVWAMEQVSENDVYGIIPNDYLNENHYHHYGFESVLAQ